MPEMRQKFTVGMAVFNDFNGVYFTTQSLKVHHGEWIGQIVVVDNKACPRTERYCRSIGATYVNFPEPKGTSAPREEIFRHATFPRTVVLDSHVLLYPGFFEAMDKAVTTDDLFHGPLMYDWSTPEQPALCATHMDDVWRGQMWGIWGHAIEGDGVPPFSVVNNKTIDLATGKEIELPDGKLTADLERRGYKIAEGVFEIPAHGMGMWACKTSSWLHFNPAFREFGGEEWYIHEKYRKAGRKVLCVSDAKWAHRFSDLTAAPIEYPLSRIAKIKNYIIGHRELGLPLDRIEKEFVGNNLISKKDWDMACGCSTATGSPVVTKAAIPPGLLPKEGSVIDFHGGEFPGCMVARPLLKAADAPAQDCDLVVLGDAFFALSKWPGKAKRILVRGGTPQVGPFLMKHMDYTLTKQTDGWCLLSSLAEDKKEIAGMGTMVINGLLALGRAAKASMRGLPLVDDATQEKRLTICATCPMRTNTQCSICTCFVEKKTWVSSEQCPEGKWLKVT